MQSSPPRLIHHARSFLTMTWLLLVPACSDDPADPATNTQVSQFCDTIAEQRCKGRASCCAESSSAAAVAACRKAEQVSCVAASKELEPAIEAKTVRIDSVALQRCVDDMAAAAAACSLPEPATVAVSCGAVMVEGAPLGAPCNAGIEGVACALGAGRCRQSGKGLQCVLFTTDAIACSSDLPCADGLRCLPSKPGLGPNTALPGTCGAPRGVGAACSSHGHCVAGSRCSGDGVCEASPMAGSEATATGSTSSRAGRCGSSA